MALPKLSILIPTYNFVCVDLVSDLAKQAGAIRMMDNTALLYEIIVADDTSTDESTIVANRHINAIDNCRFVEFETNLGRARIRNKLIEMSQYDYLLFIDSDAKVCSTQFVQTYIDAANYAKVICGGVANFDTLPSREVRLRYMYEKRMEDRYSAVQRSKHPYRSFTTFNFAANKEILEENRFDERCRNYGYEDALFGLSLRDKKISIMHIDNRLIHTGLEPDIIYLDKVETALRTLHSIGESMQSDSGVSRCAKRLERMHLRRLTGYAFRAMRPLLRRCLFSSLTNVPTLQIYKLGYYCSLK